MDVTGNNKEKSNSSRRGKRASVYTIVRYDMVDEEQVDCTKTFHATRLGLHTTVVVTSTTT